MKSIEYYLRMCHVAIREKIGELNEDEKQELKNWLNDEKNIELFNSIQEPDAELLSYYKNYNSDRQLKKFHFKRKRRFIWSTVASILIIFSISLFFAKYNQTFDTATEEPKNNISLILDNGERINLSSLSPSEPMLKEGIKIDNVNNQLTYEILSSDSTVSYNTLIIPKAAIYNLILSDGTNIWLNSDSKITYQTHLVNNIMQVELEGEAYFKVNKEIERQFIVKTEGMNIKVLGTEFNVNTYADDGYIYSALVEGSIEINLENGEKHSLVPGEIAKLNQHGDFSISKENLNIYTSWMNNLFYFRNTHLKDLLKQVERFYDVSIVWEDEIEEYYTGSISRDRSLKTLLDVLEMTIPVEFIIIDNSVIVKHKNKL